LWLEMRAYNMDIKATEGKVTTSLAPVGPVLEATV
jgi:hypothetical protein